MLINWGYWAVGSGLSIATQANYDKSLNYPMAFLVCFSTVASSLFAQEYVTIMDHASNLTQIKVHIKNDKTSGTVAHAGFTYIAIGR